jgi:hypothetical protein
MSAFDDNGWGDPFVDWNEANDHADDAPPPDEDDEDQGDKKETPAPAKWRNPGLSGPGA